ncbi:sulfite oxidase-like oxidoreductase [Arthrobacter sp. ISL-85]|uniref:sulfite oxidase-like oxidoreductase n=1 Tax=Arthrobacter sp. ISL-85 TaxID=2819115 RepID=UPI001BE88E7C|nr:sulfite oxidase-like oxidoreductase [Arthrobacter sp. ISL-85]MBT2566349.1 sulfite oxidase-like oxidoreductase [Arthrobacter sp. ISL-85]
MAVFGGRRQRGDNPALPPGQFLTGSFPVLSAGPTPSVSAADWEFTIRTETGKTHRWNWAQFMALPSEIISADIHCVTSWSKLNTAWRGVSLDTFFDDVETESDFVMAHSYGGYTTNLPLKEVLNGQAWIAHEYDGKSLDPEHGGPARLLIPHLYFWKSAKWVRGLVMQNKNAPGFWERNGYNLHGDPWREERYS